MILEYCAELVSVWVALIPPAASLGPSCPTELEIKVYRANTLAPEWN